MELIKKNNKLYVDNVYVCDCMDPGILKAGSYRLEINRSPKFKKELPLIYNKEFPATRGFRIHQGNRMKDSNGCSFGKSRADYYKGKGFKEFVVNLEKEGFFRKNSS